MLFRSGDPYLDECAADKNMFAELVKNEWRLETCFEGDRYYNLRRWAGSDLNSLNVDINGIGITPGMLTNYDYAKTIVETLKYPSLWSPIPYMDVRMCPNLVQNEGWESWR